MAYVNHLSIAMFNKIYPFVASKTIVVRNLNWIRVRIENERKKKNKIKIIIPNSDLFGHMGYVFVLDDGVLYSIWYVTISLFAKNQIENWNGSK